MRNQKWRFASNPPLLFHHCIAKSSLPPFSYRFFQSLSHNDNLNSLFRRYGFSPHDSADFLRKNDFLQNSSPREIEASFRILLSLNPSHESLVSTVTGSPSVLRLAFLQNWKLGTQQLALRNLASTAIQNVLVLASRFALSPDDFSSRVERFKGLGLSDATVAGVLEAAPMAIMSAEDELRSKLEFLARIGIRRSEIGRVIRLFPRVLEFGVEKRLNPLIGEFFDFGFTLRDVRREVVREPQVLGFENGELSHCIEMVRSLKCRPPIKQRILRDGEFRAGYEVKSRVDCLRKHGLIYRDAFTVLWKEPRAIVYAVKEIEKKIDFLVNEMKFGIENLVEVPEYLGLNFDKQIVPRFNVIEHLRSRGGLGDEVELRKLVKMSRLRFYNMYVKPYPECDEIYGRFAEKSGVRRRHPVGIWKLFRPKKYAETEEDVRNIKWFMDSLPK